jgi:catechol 2,3-dioxygenase-like lactoylglutathione lyase family enzyme
MRTVSWCVMALLLACGLGHAEPGELPWRMPAGHINLVYSVSDADAVHRVYGEAIGLKRIPDIDFPGDPYMIRYLGGQSEIKFIVTGRDLPKHEGGTNKARGIRLLALLFPMSEQAPMQARFEAAGLEWPAFVGGSRDDYDFEYGMIFDGDGNQVELVFLSEGAPESKFKQAQIGLAVSDMAAMDAFLTDVLGLTPEVTDQPIHRYGLGVSQIKFWNVDPDLPAWNGSPMQQIGMNLVQFIVFDVDAVREQVLARGGTIHTEPFPLGTLATIMFVEGPDGILFEFAGPLLDRFKK